MNSQYQSGAMRYLKYNRFEDLDKSLRNVTDNVLAIAKRSATTKKEMTLKLAKLKKEKLDTLALVARCQAALASMEVMIAENELADQLNFSTSKDSKRKCSDRKSDNNKASLKKNKTSENKGITVSNQKRPSDKGPNSKSSRKPSQKSSKVTRTEEVLNGGATLPTTKDKKENNMANNNKENCNLNPFPSVGKRIIILSQPPLRKDTNKTGYLSETHQLKQSKVENSIYDIARTAENFGNSMLSATNSSFHNQNEVTIQNPAIDINHNQTAISNQNLTAMNCNQNETICNQNQGSITKQTYRDQTYFIYNNLPIYHQQLNSQDTTVETNNLVVNEENIKIEHFQTTNEIFKDIMNKKGTISDKVIKIENDCYSDITYEETVYLDIPNDFI